MGLASDIVAIFDEKRFRKQVKMLVLELHKYSLDIELSDEFEEYIEKMQFVNTGVVQRVKDYVGQLF